MAEISVWTAPVNKPIVLEWKAIYDDGTSLSQFNEDKTENKYTMIDRNKLVQFQLLKDKNPIVIVHFQPGQKLIYRRRVAMNITGSVRIDEVVYLVGWQQNKEGINVQMLCVVFEDGHVEIIDKFREDHPWFYPVRFLPEETV